jgi:hypothetical protein
MTLFIEREDLWAQIPTSGVALADLVVDPDPHRSTPSRVSGKSSIPPGAGDPAPKRNLRDELRVHSSVSMLADGSVSMLANSSVSMLANGSVSMLAN